MPLHLLFGCHPSPKAEDLLLPLLLQLQLHVFWLSSRRDLLLSFAVGLLNTGCPILRNLIAKGGYSATRKPFSPLQLNPETVVILSEAKNPRSLLWLSWHRSRGYETPKSLLSQYALEIGRAIGCRQIILSRNLPAAPRIRARTRIHRVGAISTDPPSRAAQHAKLERKRVLV